MPARGGNLGSAALIVAVVGVVFVIPVAIALIGSVATGSSGDVPPGALLLVYALVASAICGPLAGILGAVGITLAIAALARPPRPAPAAVALILSAVCVALPIVLLSQFGLR